MDEVKDPWAQPVRVVYFRPLGAAESPVEKEYHREVRQPRERAKIDAVLEGISLFALHAAAGVRFEKIKGTPESLYELKVKAFGSEHGFFAGYAPVRTVEGFRILVLLKYVKKKESRLRRVDIETAAGRLARMEVG